MSPIDPSLSIRRVRLAVSDLDASTRFYSRVLGLPVIERDDTRSALGTDPALPALELLALEDALAPRPGSTGLFHVAWLHPSRADLAETVRRVAAAGWRFTGASDHGVSEALYLDDPDGLGIELYADRPREDWARPAGGGVEMVTLPLDLEDLLAASDGVPAPEIAPGTGIGHVHLKVADVDRAAAFYEGLGFEEQARMPSAAFVSAGGYHHHLGLNSWQSAGGAADGDRAPGLRLVDFALADTVALDELARAAETIDAAPRRENGSLLLSDPDGETLRFSASSPPAPADRRS